MLAQLLYGFPDFHGIYRFGEFKREETLSVVMFHVILATVRVAVPQPGTRIDRQIQIDLLKAIAVRRWNAS